MLIPKIIGSINSHIKSKEEYSNIKINMWVKAEFIEWKSFIKENTINGIKINSEHSSGISYLCFSIIERDLGQAKIQDLLFIEKVQLVIILLFICLVIYPSRMD